MKDSKEEYKKFLDSISKTVLRKEYITIAEEYIKLRGKEEIENYQSIKNYHEVVKENNYDTFYKEDTYDPSAIPKKSILKVKKNPLYEEDCKRLEKSFKKINDDETDLMQYDKIKKFTKSDEDFALFRINI